jgi:hypothetical protein
MLDINKDGKLNKKDFGALIEKFIDVDGETCVRVYTVNGGSSVSDGKVKYDVSDPTSGYISEKIIAGTGISVAEGTGANENKLEITNSLDLSGYFGVFKSALSTRPPHFLTYLLTKVGRILS